MAQYQMQALSSGVAGDGTLKSWLSSSADYAGAGFPGPGTAADIVVVGGGDGGSGGGGGGGGASDVIVLTGQAPIVAVASAPGWTVAGAFPMATTSSIILQATGSVSDAALTMSVRLYCVTAGSVGVVGSTAVITSLTDVKAVSTSFSITGGLVYQIQVQVVGAVAGSGYLRRAALVGA